MLFGFGLYASLFYILVAIGFFFGGIYNLFSKEGRYDAESNKIMTLSSIFGIIVGGLMFLHMFGVVDIPFVPYI